MKRTLAVLLIVLGTLTSLSAQDASAVKGAWTMTIETPQGATPIGLNFSAVDGEKISGVLSSPQGDVNVSGTLKGAEINFTCTFEGNGRSIVLTFAGKVDKDTMSGQADFGGMGSGNWSAKRPG